MSLWLSGMSVPSVDVKRDMRGGSMYLWPVLEGGTRVQGDTEVRCGNSVFSKFELMITLVGVITVLGPLCQGQPTT